MNDFKYRTFLNPDGRNAFVTMRAEIENYRSFNAAVDIGDCSRIINLDFDVYNYIEGSKTRDQLIEDRIRKCDVLISVFEMMKYQLNEFKNMPTNPTSSGS